MQLQAEVTLRYMVKHRLALLPLDCGRFVVISWRLVRFMVSPPISGLRMMLLSSQTKSRNSSHVRDRCVGVVAFNLQNSSCWTLFLNCN